MSFHGLNDDIVTSSKTQAREYELCTLRMQNEAMQAEVVRLRQLLQTVALAQASAIEKKTNIIHPSAHTVEDKGSVHPRPMGRNASVATVEALRKLTKPVDELAPQMLQALNNPLRSVEYLSSPNFAADLVALCRRVRGTFEAEMRVLFVQSPVYVFGDIHGNLEDLRFFSDNIWTLGVPLTAGRFLFLGDYVDRGMHSIEVVAYVFALKLQNPGKVFLLRGNHELRDVNGWEDHYKEKSFLRQCKNRWGEEMGMQVWEEVNQVFDRLPLAAVVDNDIFCVHGGIPRPRHGGSRVNDILTVPAVAGISPYYAHEDEESVRVASECLWSDPAKPSQELTLGPDGYGDSPRGAGAVCFGGKAVDDFLLSHGYSYIVRAHEAHSEGVSLSKGAKVFTVFSTSKDHNQGQGAMAGCMLIDSDQIQVINRSPQYKNRIIRRRCSAATLGLPANWTEQGKRLGLIVDTASSNDLLAGRRRSRHGNAGLRLLSDFVNHAFGGGAANAVLTGNGPMTLAAQHCAGGFALASPAIAASVAGGGGGAGGAVLPASGAAAAAIAAAVAGRVFQGRESEDAHLIDVFVDTCDLDDGHSSEESDDETADDATAPGTPPPEPLAASAAAAAGAADVTLPLDSPSSAAGEPAAAAAGNDMEL